MRTIALLNQKGGVGKTTTAVNLAAALALEGKRVVVVDLDPQANLTVHLGLEVGAEDPSSYRVLIGDVPFADALRDTATPGLRALPTDLDLSGAELELANRFGRETLLRDAITTWREGHRAKAGEEPADFVLLDCPPSLGLLSVNALAASDEVFICVQTEFFALRGLSKLMEIVELVQRRLHPQLQVSGIIPCLYDSRLRLAREVLAELKGYFGAQVFGRNVGVNVKLAEAPSYGQTIFEYAPESSGARDYQFLAKEVLGERPSAQAAEPEERAKTPQDPEGEVDRGEVDREEDSAPADDRADAGGEEPAGASSAEPPRETVDGPVLQPHPSAEAEASHRADNPSSTASGPGSGRPDSNDRSRPVSAPVTAQGGGAAAVRTPAPGSPASPAHPASEAASPAAAGAPESTAAPGPPPAGPAPTAVNGDAPDAAVAGTPPAPAAPTAAPGGADSTWPQTEPAAASWAREASSPPAPGTAAGAEAAAQGNSLWGAAPAAPAPVPPTPAPARLPEPPPHRAGWGHVAAVPAPDYSAPLAARDWSAPEHAALPGHTPEMPGSSRVEAGAGEAAPGVAQPAAEVGSIDPDRLEAPRSVDGVAETAAAAEGLRQADAEPDADGGDADGTGDAASSDATSSPSILIPHKPAEPKLEP
ncbi:MAG: AAA family ATPase [Planctomycetota bacterium]